MKRKEWRVLLTNEAKKCKHEQFVCRCGSIAYVYTTPTKAEQLELKRFMRQVAKAQELEQLKHED